MVLVELLLTVWWYTLGKRECDCFDRIGILVFGFASYFHVRFHAAEYLLGDLGQRVRDIRQGPDGLIYILTDHEAPVRGVENINKGPGVLLRLEPVR